MSIVKWIGESAPVKIRGSGSYPSEPIIPSLSDNFFVPVLLLLGLYFIVISMIEFKLHKSKT